MMMEKVARGDVRNFTAVAAIYLCFAIYVHRGSLLRVTNGVVERNEIVGDIYIGGLCVVAAASMQ
jgi:hypothetical protein